MVANIERRSFECEFRAEEENGESRLVGYASVFNSMSHDLGGFREIVLPGAFRDTLESDLEVKALLNHNSDFVLGSKRAKTLRLKEDEHGLRTVIVPPDTSYGRDLVISVQRGDQGGMSFGFVVRSDNWRKEGGAVVRELRQVDLIEVSTTPFPAYPQTDVTVAKRSLESWLAQHDEEWHPSADLLRRKLELKRKG